MTDKLWEFDGKNIVEKDTGYFVVVDINCRKDDVEHIVHCVNTHQALIDAFNPRTWTQEMSDAWHRNLPDTQKAFDALREAAILAAKG